MPRARSTAKSAQPQASFIRYRPVDAQPIANGAPRHPQTVDVIANLKR
jgi:hypothetical protein